MSPQLLGLLCLLSLSGTKLGQQLPEHLSSPRQPREAQSGHPHEPKWMEVDGGGKDLPIHPVSWPQHPLHPQALPGSTFMPPIADERGWPVSSVNSQDLMEKREDSPSSFSTSHHLPLPKGQGSPGMVPCSSLACALAVPTALCPQEQSLLGLDVEYGAGCGASELVQPGRAQNSSRSSTKAGSHSCLPDRAGLAAPCPLGV